MGKACFPASVKATEEFTLQVKRIAHENGLKYRKETINRGLGCWVPSTIRPVIYRKVLNSSEDKTDLSNYSIDDVVIFEDDHFILKQGYEHLRRDLKDLYAVFSIVRQAEEEVEVNRKKLGEYEIQERDARLEQTSLETEEITAIIEQNYQKFKDCAEKDGFEDMPVFAWRYKDCITRNKDYDRYSLFGKFDKVLSLIKFEIKRKFEERANTQEISDKFYEKWRREGRRIIISRRQPS